MLNERSEKFAAWGGPACAVLMMVGLWMARMIPWWHQPDPKASGIQIEHFFVAHLTAIRFGMILCMGSWAFFLVWGAAIAVRCREIEGDRVPLWTYVQIASVGAGTAIATIFGVFWEITAYRAGSIPPEITRTLDDISWFFFVVPVAPYCMWCIAIAVPIFSDRNTESVFPRWFGYVCIVNAIGLLEDFFMIFFKSGALGWKGAICVYIPLTIFCVWLIAGTYCLLTAKKRPDLVGAQDATTAKRSAGEAPYVPQTVGAS
jgi:hypothetical protein